MYFFQNKDKTMIPQRYLKFWGNDYPYLSENSVQSWLPIPEDSKAQRHIRNYNTETKIWIRGNDFIMGSVTGSGTLSDQGMVY
jgi:hypothetical protein